VEWHTAVRLSSDHVPIHVTVSEPNAFIEAEKRTFINFNKADWPNFTEYIDNRLSNAPSPTDARLDEKVLRQIIVEASKRYIPAGRINNVRPSFPAEAIRLEEERDALRASDLSNPRIAELTNEMRQIVTEHRRNKWIRHLETCANGSKKLWTTIKNLSGKKKAPPRTAICFNGTQYTDDKKCAKHFCRQFVPQTTTRGRANRSILRKLRKIKCNITTAPFTTEEIIAAISKAKPSKAIGPDGIATLMLKHLPQSGFEYLTSALNLVITQMAIPTIWKDARIIPIL